MKHWKYYLPAWLWTCVILLLTLLPSQALPENTVLNHIPQFDKLVHACFFGMFVLLWSAANFLRYGSAYRHKVFMLILIGIILGVLIEFLQKDVSFIHRDFEIGDMIADAIGACLGGWLSIYHLPRWIQSILH
ncbi:MAG: VanZ family protein [Thermoflavifilum sp.]|nr:VanZ family protein [Thermoflavifilum sp.]